MSRTALIALAGGLVALAAVFAVIFWLTGPDGAEEGEPMATEGTSQPQAAGPESPAGGEPAPEQESPASVIQTGDAADSALAGGAAPPQQQEELPELPWQTDSANDLTPAAAQSLAAIHEAAPFEARFLTDSYWVSDTDLLLEDQLALANIAEIASANPDLVRIVVSRPWLRDELTGEALFALDQVRALAPEQPELAATLASSPWADDGITLAEQLTFAAVRDVAEEDPALARRIAEAPEVADGLSAEELAAFTGSDNYYLERLEREFPALAETIKAYAWLSDDLSLNRLPDGNPGPERGGAGVLASPLLADPLSDLERLVLVWIKDVAKRDQDLAQRLAALPWLADDVTEDEYIALIEIDKFSRHSREYVELLLEQPWVLDEFTEEDVGLLHSLSRCILWEDVCVQHITGGRVEARTFSFPTGDIRVMVVSTSPLGENSDWEFDKLRTSMEALHDFMGTYLVMPRLIVYRVVEPTSGGGRYSGRGHISIRGRPEGLGTTHYHEMAHHYATGGPGWLTEGGAEFLTQYICQFAGQTCSGNVGSMAARYAQLTASGPYDSLDVACGQYPKVRDYLYEKQLPCAPCSYKVGERLLLGMYLEFDQQITRAALRDLWRWDRRQGLITEEDVYQAFLNNTPPERHEEFKEHYLRLHGGPPGYAPNIDVAEVSEDLEALVAFYEARNGRRWHRDLNWLSDRPLNEWEGVFTDRSDPDRVQSLFMQANGLQGPFPLELANLSNLRGLNLEGNQLTGPIPPELGNLSGLGALILSGNGLSGPIPPDLGKLTNLERLELGGNQLSGPIPPELANLTRLRTFEVAANQLSGPLPAWLGSLPDLTSINVAANQLTGQIPPELDKLSDQLFRLSLAGNGFTGCVPGRLPQVMTRDQFVALGLPACDESLPDPGYAAGSIEGDRAALEALYHATNGPQWGADRRWLTGEDISQWHGVVLAPDGRVNWLELQGFGLQGSLPAELGNLDALHTIRLAGNQLTGSIPPELGNLSHLEVLDLRGNQLTGPIPPELGNLVKLRNLFLQDNQLTGPIPPEMGNVGQDGMSSFNLQNNQLSGQLPSELAQLRAASLRLDGNQFTGCLPVELSGTGWNREQLGLLTCVPGQDINEQGAAADRAALEALYHATDGPNWKWSDNWLTDKTLDFWEGVKQGPDGRVVELTLGFNNLTGTIPPELGKLSRLQVLKLDRNELSGEIPKELANLSELIRADLGDNHLTGVIPRELDGLLHREVLELVPGNDLTTGERAILEAVYHAGNGANWTTNDDWLSDLPVGRWEGVTTDGLGFVYRLRIDGMQGALSPEIANLRHLRELHIRSSEFESLPELGDLSYLEVLELETNAAGPIPSGLANMSNLWNLDLEGNHTGPIPPELGELSNLIHLNLGQNQLSGPIPSELGNLTNLTSLNLWENQLTGPIPPELGNLTNLKHLSLGGNQLTGSIPPELGSLSNLENLDLRDNQLSGQIPMELLNLPRRARDGLNGRGLYGNQFTGCVPAEFDLIIQSLGLPPC